MVDLCGFESLIWHLSPRTLADLLSTACRTWGSLGNRQSQDEPWQQVSVLLGEGGGDYEHILTTITQVPHPCVSLGTVDALFLGASDVR